MAIALTGGTVIDATGAEPKPKTSVVIDGTRIVEITPKTEFGPEVETYDVSGKTVLPGIIDSHVHLGPWMQWIISQQTMPLTYILAKQIFNMRRFLELGVTSARDLGGFEAGLVYAQRDGLLPGPRMQSCLVIIQPTNGVTDNMPGVGGTITPQGLTSFLPGLPSPWADGPYAVRAKVREVLRFGAEVVKCANNATPWTQPYLDVDRPLFTFEEMQALVDEAHRAGAHVCCHVTAVKNVRAVLEAIRAGVDLIDHGPYLDDECVEEMAKRGTWYCPMASIIDFHSKRNPDPYVNKVAVEVLRLTKESVARAHKAGVKICLGTDGGIETGWQGQEMMIMHECGLTPMEAIMTGTSWAAESMGWQDKVGSLEVGKEADLVVVDGDPIKDIKVMVDQTRYTLVMQAGKAVSGPMSKQFPYEPPLNMNMLPVRPVKRSW
ncbi:MAG: amidohydrolase family protein [Pseudomonadota bacterium]